MTCDPTLSGFQTINDYILGLGGEQLTEMGVNQTISGSGSNATVTSTLTWQHANIWAGGKLLGTYDGDGLHFYFDDPLGTRRAQTDSAGVIEQTCGSLPFGDALTCENPGQSPYFASVQYPTEHHFTGKERDTESGNDYFGARYYASSMGRFMSPDPLFVSVAHLANPQRWNEYAYGLNNPELNVDADGRFSSDGHTAITADAFTRAGISTQSELGKAIMAANHAVDTGHNWGLVLPFLNTQLAGSHQADHFLAAPYQTQKDAYDDAMVRLNTLTYDAYHQVHDHGSLDAAENIGAALHEIQDSYAHAHRDGAGSIIKIDCFTCTRLLFLGKHTHHDPDATNHGKLTEIGNQASQASSAYLWMMNHAKYQTEDEFQESYREYTTKYFTPKLTDTGGGKK